MDAIHRRFTRPWKFILFFSNACVLAGPVWGADPFSSVVKPVNEQESQRLGALTGTSPDNLIPFTDFNYAESVSTLGSIALGGTNGAQSIEFNVINYDIRLGDNKVLPFQLVIGNNAPASGKQEDVEDSNAANLLDPDAGVAINFPFLKTYNPGGGGVCSFEDSSVGGCVFGAELTFAYKNLENTDGKTETAFGQTLRLGGSLRFPVFEGGSDDQAGFLALTAKAVFSHIDNLDDSTALFAPVLDVNGNPVKFDNSIRAAEFEMKLSFDSKFSLTARWVKPFSNEELFDDRFHVSLEKQF